MLRYQEVSRWGRQLAAASMSPPNLSPAGAPCTPGSYLICMQTQPTGSFQVCSPAWKHSHWPPWGPPGSLQALVPRLLLTQGVVRWASCPASSLLSVCRGFAAAASLQTAALCLPPWGQPSCPLPSSSASGSPCLCPPPGGRPSLTLPFAGSWVNQNPAAGAPKGGTCGDTDAASSRGHNCA